MNISLLQLNLFANKYKENLFPYLQKNDFDVLLLQEITGPNTKFGNVDSQSDNFQELTQVLGDSYASELSITETFTDNEDAYLAMGIFYRKTFSLVKREEVFLHKNEKPFPAESKEYEKLSHSVLSLTLSAHEQQFTVLTTHGAWGGTPFEKPHQTAQGDILLQHLQHVTKPFIFTADMNLNSDQPLIKKIGMFARNLVDENHVTNTLNPRTHAAKHMFPAGAAVDFIFVSDDITVNKFEVVQEDLSDHLGLRAEIEV